MTELNQFFRGLQVVELANVLAGPAVGLFFAELGATVRKVENITVGGDVTRGWKLPQEDPEAPASAYFFSVNWGKEHHFLDLRQPADRQKLDTWLATADVIVANFKAGSAEKLGLDSPTLRQRYPRLIYASLSAYGPDDPRPGFDVALQAETGWLSMNGPAGGPPCKLPVALIDLLAAHQLKEGILLALLKRERTGEGSNVHVSLFDASLSALANQASNWLNVGVVPGRMGSLHPNIAPYGEIFHSSDGQPLLLATGTAAHFVDLCRCLEIPEQATSEAFCSNVRRLQNREALQAVLATAFSRFTAAELVARFTAAKVPVSPIRNLAEVFALPAAKQLILTEKTTKEESKRVKTAVFTLGDK